MAMTWYRIGLVALILGLAGNLCASTGTASEHGVAAAQATLFCEDERSTRGEAGVNATRHLPDNADPRVAALRPDVC